MPALERSDRQSLLEAITGRHSERALELLKHLSCDAEAYGLALRLASAQGSLPIMTALLDRGINPNVVDACGETPLMLAAQAGEANAIRLLVERGADLEFRSITGLTALMHAARSNRPEAVEALLRLGADPQARDHASNTPLDWAKRTSFSFKVPVVRLLVYGMRKRQRRTEVTRLLERASRP